MRFDFADAMLTLAMLLTIGGVTVIYWPAGLIVAGLMAGFLAFLMGSGRPR